MDVPTRRGPDRADSSKAASGRVDAHGRPVYPYPMDRTNMRDRLPVTLPTDSLVHGSLLWLWARVMIDHDARVTALARDWIRANPDDPRLDPREPTPRQMDMVILKTLGFTIEHDGAPLSTVEEEGEGRAQPRELEEGGLLAKSKWQPGDEMPQSEMDSLLCDAQAKAASAMVGSYAKEDDVESFGSDDGGASGGRDEDI